MMKLSLVKPLSAMLASIVMCGVFSLSFSNNAKSHCQLDHFKSHQEINAFVSCHFADGKVSRWEQHKIFVEKEKLQKALKGNSTFL